jgi:hypothetical protein
MAMAVSFQALAPGIIRTGLMQPSSLRANIS